MPLLHIQALKAYTLFLEVEHSFTYLTLEKPGCPDYYSLSQYSLDSCHEYWYFTIAVVKTQKRTDIVYATQYTKLFYKYKKFK